MGSNSSRARRMGDEENRSRSGSEDDSDQEIDYAAILQSLINRYTKYELRFFYGKYLLTILLQWFCSYYCITLRR